MEDKNRTKTQRRRKRAKPPRQITELHTSKAGRTGAEEKARESEYWKKAIIDSIPSVAWLKDKEYRFVAVNECLCEALGMRAEDLTGKTDFDVWPRDLAEQFRADDEEVMKTGKPKRVEEQWGLAGGDRIWIETIKTPIFDEKGEVIATSGITHDITERKQAEEELSREHNLLRALVDNLPDRIFVKDTNSTFIFANIGCARHLGAEDPQAVIGKTTLDFLPPEAAEESRAQELEITRTGKGIINQEVCRKDASGRTQWYLSTKVPWRDDSGNIIGIVGLNRDITEIKRAEEKLRESQRLQQAIMDGNPDMAWVKDKESRYVMVNESMAEAFDIKLADIVGKTDFDLVPKDLAEKYRADDQKVMKTGKRIRIEEQWACKGGERIWIETVKTPLYNDKGEVIGTSGIALDITERKQAEEQIRKHREELQIILDSMPTTVWYKDTANKILRVNKAAAASMGLKPEDLEGKAVSELFPKDADHYYEDDLEVINSGKPKWDIIEQLQLPSGERRWVHTDKVPYRDEQGNIAGVIAFVADITERKRAENQRQRLTELLKEKNRELEEIIRVATHDMRTPMVNIEGFSRILASSCEQIQSLIEGQKIPNKLKNQLDEVIGQDIPEAVGIINSGVSKMNSLLDGLLRLAKVGYSATEMVQLDMNTKIENIVDAMRFQVEQSGAEIKVEPLPSCLGDKSQINQVFSNLLGNALKYLDPSRPGQVYVSGHIEKDYSVYCVQDNGIGIATDNIDNIFKMFYRVRPVDDDGGDGLGLAIVRRIVNRHNGEIWAESEVGKGSKFFVKLLSQ